MKRMKMKYMGALLAAATLTSVATVGAESAEAAILIDSVTSAADYSSFVKSGNPTIPNLGNRLINFNGDPSVTTFFPGKNQEVSYSGGGIVSGSESGQYAAPAADADGDGNSNKRDNTPYLSIGGSEQPGPATFKFFKYPIISTLGFLWGSVDAYNSVSFLRDGNTLATFDGNDISNPANGDQGINGTFFVNFKGNDGENDYFDTVVFNSTSAAFELDDIRYTEVPTPALLPGLIGVGVAALRKRKQVGEAQEA